MSSKLLKYNSPNSDHKNIDFFYSLDMKDDMELHDEMALDIASWKTVENFIEMNPDYKKLIDVYAKKNNLEGIAILAAHGEKIKNSWFYFNGNAGHPIQKWIDINDGKYKALILYSCNPGKNEIKSNKTPVLAPNEIFSHRLLDKGKVQIELFMPGTGYLDSYMIEEEMKKWGD
jgi:hypothetical protein